MRIGIALFFTTLAAACGGAEPQPPQSCDGEECRVSRCGFSPSGSDQKALVFRSNAPFAEVQIIREWAEQGVGHSAIYALRSFAVTHDGELHCLDEQLDYENSHHNWIDWAYAERPGGGRYALEIRFQPDDPQNPWEFVWSFKLHPRDATDQPLIEPIRLELSSGTP